MSDTETFLLNSKIGLINEKMEFGSLKRWNKYKIELYLQLWMRCTTNFKTAGTIFGI